MDAAEQRLVVARGPRIVIRTKMASDAAQDYRWRQDPEVAKYDGTGVISVGFREFVAQMEAEIVAPSPHRRVFALLLEEGGEHIGNIMFYNVTPSREEAEVGISIGADANRGRGLGVEAMVVFLRMVWGNYPFRRLVLHTLEWNERARACFRASGFTEVGTVVRNGDPYVRMECRREWWLLWDGEGRFDARLRAGEGERDRQGVGNAGSS